MICLSSFRQSVPSVTDRRETKNAILRTNGEGSSKPNFNAIFINILQAGFKKIRAPINTHTIQRSVDPVHLYRERRIRRPIIRVFW